RGPRASVPRTPCRARTSAACTDTTATRRTAPASTGRQARPAGWQDGLMPDETKVELGQVQRTLFIPLLARARESRSGRPRLSDPKAVELVGAIDFNPATYGSGPRFIVVIRTMILDWWVRQFLADHPRGTVVCAGGSSRIP